MRRLGLAVGIVVAAAIAPSVSAARFQAVPVNPIQAENALQGTASWASLGNASWPEIQLYTSEGSVVPGATINVHVSTNPVARYRLELFRLGWYQGAGARLIACKPSCTTSEQGSSFPTPNPDAYGEVRANWPVTNSFTLPRTATSGYYEVEAVLMSGADAGRAWAAPVIVREPPTEHSSILVVASVNTWQAYNNWGGKSLYAYNSAGGAAVKVSFDRPNSPDAQSPLLWEYPLVRFLERNGYDVSYTTDVDVDQNPAELADHRLVIVAGHDEYWTKTMRDAFDAALAQGTNLAFFGADIGTWQVRYEDGGRTLVAYRSRSQDPQPDPSLKTVRFRELGRPPCSLLGVEFQRGQATVGDPPRDYAVTSAGAQSTWAASGLAGTLPDLVGYEWDAVVPGCTPSDAVTLLHYEGKPANADAIEYTAPSGARVFSAGSLQLNWGLDGYGSHASHASPPLQTFVGRMLDDLGRPPAPTSIQASREDGSVRIDVTPAAGNAVIIVRHPGAAAFFTADAEVVVVCETKATACVDRDPPGHRIWTYAAATLVGSALSVLMPAGPVDVPNHAPSLKLHALSRANTVQVTAVAADADNDRLLVHWNVNGKRIPTTRNVVRLSRVRRPQLIVCSVDDGHGGVAHARVVVPRLR